MLINYYSVFNNYLTFESENNLKLVQFFGFILCKVRIILDSNLAIYFI